jgi:hypothetical protein
MVQLSATRCSCIAILYTVQLYIYILYIYVLYIVFISLWLSPETFGYTLVINVQNTDKSPKRVHKEAFVIDNYYSFCYLQKNQMEHELV